MKNTELVDRAIVFAVKAHAGVFRDSTEIPYILHPLEAAAIAAGISEDPEIIAAAVLHDVIEDTEYTAEDIRRAFGERVLSLVNADTEDKREGRPWEETWDLRKQETLDFLRDRASYEQKIVVFSDKLANMRAIWRDYRNIGDRLWKRFSAPKEKQAWYYGSFIGLTAELSSSPLHEEYARLVSETFGTR